MNKNKLPSLVSILGLTLLTAIVWVSFDVYRAFTKIPNETLPKEITNPISPVLDLETLEKIQSGLYFDASQIPDNIVTGIPSAGSAGLQISPTPSPTPTPEASTSATPISEANTATGSSEISQ